MSLMGFAATSQLNASFLVCFPHVFVGWQTKALRVLKSLQIHGVILGGWAKLHELAEELVDGITASS